MARLPRTSQGVGEEPLLLAGAMSRQARSRGTERRTQGGAGLWEGSWASGRGLRPQIGPPSPLQDWDYTYVHSFYHCALAMAFVLLLPKVNKKAGSAGPPTKLHCSTLCCACI